MRTIKKSDKKSSHIIEIVSCIIFFGFFIIFALITIFKPKETFSELENKSLERKPKLSAKTWFDRTYTDKLEKYVADHFREELVGLSLNRVLKLLSERKRSVGYMFSKIDLSKRSVNLITVMLTRV